MSVHLIHDDICRAVEQLEPESFDCIIADMPYGQTSLKWDKWVHGWPSLVRPLLKPSGSMWVFGTLRCLMDHAEDFRSGWRLSQDIVWEKQNGTGFQVDRFRRVHEQAALFYRDDARWDDVYKCPQFTYDAKAKRVHAKTRNIAHTGKIGPHVYEREEGGPRLMRSVMPIRSCHRQGKHPTQKPEALYEPLLRYACPPGGRVLDPFAGSGTTGAAARALGLSCVLVESHAPYVDVIRSRLLLEAA